MTRAVLWRFFRGFVLALACMFAVIALFSAITWGMYSLSEYLQSDWGLARNRATAVVFLCLAVPLAAVMAGIYAAKGGDQ